METLAQLKDGAEVLIRPMRQDDVERSLAFFRALPKEDRAYLRVDVTKKNVVEKRIRAMLDGEVHRLVALDGDRMVGDGALELQQETWKGHAAEFRLIVAHEYQRRGLGMVLARELFNLAASSKIEEIVAKIMRPQIGARRILDDLGFQEIATLPDYVKDLEGRKQDMVLMRCDIEALWQRMDDLIRSTDYLQHRLATGSLD